MTDCTGKDCRHNDHAVGGLDAEDLASEEARRLRAALKRLVAAEDRFVRESGTPLDDDVSQAVEAARPLLRRVRHG